MDDGNVELTHVSSKETRERAVAQRELEKTAVPSFKESGAKLPDSARDPTKISTPGNRGQWRTVGITGDIVVARYEPRCLGYTSSNIEFLPTDPRTNSPPLPSWSPFTHFVILKVANRRGKKWTFVYSRLHLLCFNNKNRAQSLDLYNLVAYINIFSIFSKDTYFSAVIL